MFIEELIAQIGLPPAEILKIVFFGVLGITLAWGGLRMGKGQ